MPASTAVPRIHINDIGTLYKAEVRDQSNQPFNPTSATTKEFIFGLPSSDAPVVTRTANVVTSGVGLKQKWYLEYTVVAQDIVDGLHQSAGIYTLQAHLVFSNAEYKSNIHTYDVDANVIGG